MKEMRGRGKMGIVNDEYVRATCKPGTADCCRYLTMSPDGWECAKTNPGLKAHLDARVAANDIRAVGDNCDGK